MKLVMIVMISKIPLSVWCNSRFCKKSQCLKTARCGAPWLRFRINFTKCALANGGVIVVDTSSMSHAALNSFNVFKVGSPASCTRGNSEFQPLLNSLILYGILALGLFKEDNNSPDGVVTRG